MKSLLCLLYFLSISCIWQCDAIQKSAEDFIVAPNQLNAAAIASGASSSSNPTKNAANAATKSEGVSSQVTTSAKQKTPQSIAPEKIKTKGQSEAQITHDGLHQPVSLTTEELFKVDKFTNSRNKYLKEWKEIDLNNYSETTQGLLKSKSEKAIKAHMKPDDLAACLKEKKGVVIPKSTGAPYKHLENEFVEAGNSLKNNIVAIKEAINGNPTKAPAIVNPVEVEILTKKLSDQSKLLDLYEELLGIDKK